MATFKSGDLSPGTVADFLIEHGLLLTALEFHTELCENGQELASLREYFSNPSHFESVRTAPIGRTQSDGSMISPISKHNRNPSSSSVDSKDDTLSRMSNTESMDLIREREERIAVLEYELRKANDTIEKFRNRMTSMATDDGASSGVSKLTKKAINETTSLHPTERKALTTSAKVFEIRTLHYLMNEYLRDMGQKMAAITFANENDDQDLEEWSDVGLDVAPPPPLVELLRLHSRRQQDEPKKANETPQGSAADGKLQDELRHLREQNTSLKARISTLERLLREQSETPLSVNDKAPTKQAPVKSQDSTHDSSHSDDEDKPDGERWSFVQRHLTSMTEPVANPQLGAELLKITQEDQSTILIFGSSLPNIIPHVLLNKREELIPVILSVIKHHPEHAIRDLLTNLLFNLAKKPDDTFRNIIITGCVALAKSITPDRVEAELMPQCWEQVGHKYPERRALVAESCGALAPYVKRELRSSLMLSILQQLYTDKVDFVREAVVRNLTLLLTYITDGDKIGQVREMMISFIRDEHPTVVERAHSWLVPVFCKWTRDHKSFQQKFVLPITKDTMALLEKHESLTVLDKNNLLNEKDLKLLESNLILLKKVVRHLAVDVLLAAPFASKAIQDSVGKSYESEHDSLETEVFPPASLMKALLVKFDDHVAAGEHGHAWPEYTFLIEEWLPIILTIVGSIDVINATLFAHLNDLLKTIATTFGQAFSRSVLKPLFAAHMEAPEQPSFEAEPAEDRMKMVSLRHRLLPCYINSVMSVLGVPASMAFIRHVTIKMAETQHYWSVKDSPLVIFTLRTLCVDNAFLQALLDLLDRDLMSHPSNNVRAATIPLFQLVTLLVESHLVGKRIMPALATLAGDSDRNVHNATIAAYGTVIESVSDVELLERLIAPLQAFGEEQVHVVRMELIRAYTLATPKAEAAFRDEYILPTLVVFTEDNKTAENKTHRAERAAALVEAFRVISCCYLSEAVIYEVLQPGLRILNKELEAIGGDSFLLSGSIHELLQQTDVKLFAAGHKKGETPTFAKKERVFKLLERHFPNWVEIAPQPALTTAAPSKRTTTSVASSSATSASASLSGITTGVAASFKNFGQKLDFNK